MDADPGYRYLEMTQVQRAPAKTMPFYRRGIAVCGCSWNPNPERTGTACVHDKLSNATTNEKSRKPQTQSHFTYQKLRGSGPAKSSPKIPPSQTRDPWASLAGTLIPTEIVAQGAASLWLHCSSVSCCHRQQALTGKQTDLPCEEWSKKDPL